MRMDAIAEAIHPLARCTLVLNFELLLRFPSLHAELLADFAGVSIHHEGLRQFLTTLDQPWIWRPSANPITTAVLEGDTAALLQPQPCSSFLNDVNVIGRKLADWWAKRSVPPMLAPERLDYVFEATRAPCAGGLPRPDNRAFACGVAWWRAWQNFTSRLHELYPSAVLGRPMSACP